MSAHRPPSVRQRAAWRLVRAVRWTLKPAFVAFLRLGDYLPAPELRGPGR